MYLFCNSNQLVNKQNLSVTSAYVQYDTHHYSDNTDIPSYFQTKVCRNHPHPY